MHLAACAIGCQAQLMLVTNRSSYGSKGRLSSSFRTPSAMRNFQHSSVPHSQVPGRRVVRHKPVYGLMKDAFDAAMAEAGPLMTALNAALDASTSAASPDTPETTAAEPSSAGGGANTSPPRHATIFAAHLSVDVGYNPPEATTFSLALHSTLLCTAFNFEQRGAMEQLMALAHRRAAAGRHRRGTGGI